MVNKIFKNSYLLTILVFVLVAGVVFVIIKNINNSGQSQNGNFSKGVLALNTNKSIYALGEKVEFGLASLDKDGNTLCHSNLRLTVTDSSGKKTEFTTQNAGIVGSTTCSEDNNVTNSPDYTARFSPEKDGDYKLVLTNSDTGNKIESQFRVEKNPRFSIERTGATRINPMKADRYPMIVSIESTADFKGQVVEQIPASFDVIWQGPSKVETVGDSKTITWDVDLSAGEAKEFIYEYQAPKISPEYYTLGKVSMVAGDGKKVFEEGRFWQIASDTASTYDFNICTTTCDTSADWWASGDDVDQFPFGGSTANRNSHTEATDAQYSAIAVSDTTRWSTTDPGNTDYLLFWNEMKINQAAAKITNIDLVWEGFMTNGGTSTFYIWVMKTGTAYQTDANWVQVGTAQSISGTSDNVMTRSITSNFADYIGADGMLTWVVESTLVNEQMDTDYVKATVTYTPTDITGTVYTNEAKSANIGAANTVALYVNGTSIGTAETNASGQYTFSDVAGIAANDSIIVYLENETGNGSTITLATNATAPISSLDIITDRVIVQHETAGPITNTDLDDVDAVDAENEDGIAISGGALTVASTFELLVPSGETFAPGGDVSSEKVHIKGTYTGGSETLTMSGSGTGGCATSQSSTLPFCVDAGATFTPTSNTTKFTGSSSSSLQNTTYNNLTIDGAGPFTSLGNVTVNTALTVTSGTLSLNSTYTLSVTGNTSITGSLTISSSGDQTFTGTTTINSGGTFTRSSASGTNLFVGQVTIANGGTWTTSNNPAFTLRGGISNSGTFTSGTGTYTFNTNGQTINGSAATNFGGAVAISGAITIQNSNSNTVTITGNLTGDNASSTWQNNANATTDFKGTVLATGVLTATANPNTINYTGSSAQTVKSTTYHHLNIKPSGNSVTSLFNTGTVTVNGNLEFGNGTNTGVVVEATTNDPNISVTGNVIVNGNTTFTNSDSASATLNIDGNLTISGVFTAPVGVGDTSFTLAGNFTKTGTYNANNGQITLDTTTTSALSYTTNTTFYQFSVLSASAGKNVQFDNSETTIITNDITIQGTNCTTGRIFLDSTVNDDAWILNINTGATQNIDYIDLEDASATGSQVTPIADNSTQTGSNTNWTLNAGVCPASIDLSGVIYQTNESSPYLCSTSGNLTVYVRVDGSGSYSATCNQDTGAWLVSAVSVNSGQTVVAYLSGGSVRGSTVLITDATTKTDVHIMQDRVTLRDDVNGSITNAEIGAGNTGDADDLIAYFAGVLSVLSTFETHIYTGDTFVPGNNVVTGKLHVVGNYSGSTETLELSGSGTGTSRPLYVNGGTFTAPATTTFKGGSATDIESTTFNNLSFTPDNSVAIAYTFLGAGTINGDFTMNPLNSAALTVTLGGTTTVDATKTTYIWSTGSATTNLDTKNGSSYSLSTGFLNISAGGTLTARDSTITLTGTSGTIFTKTGTFDVSLGTSTVNFSQTTGGTTLTSNNAITFDNMQVNMSGMVGTLGNTITVNDTLTCTAGTLDTSSSNHTVNAKDVSIGASGTFYGRGSTINVTGNWANSGAYTYETSTVNLNGSGAQQVSGTTTFYNLSATTSTPRTITFVHDNVTGIAANGTLTLTGTSGVNSLTLQSDSSVEWYLQVSSAGTTVSVSYVNVSQSNAGGYKQINASNGTNVDGGNNINWLFSPSTAVLTNITGVSMTGVDVN